MTDMIRWSDPTSLSPAWADRARFAARFAPPGLRIMDVGCGAMSVETLFNPSSYLPVDVARRDDRTVVLDLNERVLSRDLLLAVDLVVLLGVIEYVHDVDRQLAAIAASGRTILCSYCATDRHANADRRSSGWVNDLTEQQLIDTLERCNFTIVQSAVYNGEQTVLIASPQGATPAWLDARFGAKPQPRATHGRSSLVLAGFYGRGNCGDEALLQCAVEAFADTFDIVISVDEHGAFPGFWDWYPYKDARIIHQTNLSAFIGNASLAGILVGGGGLPPGFAANQALAAAVAGRPAALAGIDLWRPRSGDGQAFASATKAYMDLFDLVVVRSSASLATPVAQGSTAMHGGDWALRLPVDSAPDVTVDPRRAMITLREFAIETVPRSYQVDIAHLIDAVRGRGFAPVLLPFCPEDERFLTELGLDRLAPVERCWWNPRRAKQVITSSGMMLSVGRLHPLVFAAEAQTSVAAIVPPHRRGDPLLALPKIDDLAAELGIAVLETSGQIDAFLDAPRTADHAKVRASRARTDAMIDRLRDLFGA